MDFSKLSDAQLMAVHSGDYSKLSDDDLKSLHSASTPPPEVSHTESALRGAAQGATLGYADEATGGLEALKDKLMGQGGDKSLTDLYRQHRDESRANYDAAQKANPNTYLAGQLGGGVATALVPGLGQASLAGRVATGAAFGGAMGLGNSKADLTQGDVAGAVKDTAIGAGVGAAVPAAIGGIGAGIKRFAGNDVANFIASKETSGAPAGRFDPFTKQPLEAPASPPPKSYAGFDPFTKQPISPLKSWAPAEESAAAAQPTPTPIAEPAPLPDPTPDTTQPSSALSNGLKKGAGMIGAAVGGSIGAAAGHPITGTYLGKEAGQAVAKYGPDLVKSIVSSKIFSGNMLNRIANSKYSDMIGSAAQRGNNALSTASFLLAQSDPEFRQLTSQEK